MEIDYLAASGAGIIGLIIAAIGWLIYDIRRLGRKEVRLRWL